MHTSTRKSPGKTLSAEPSFDRDYARYKHLSAGMDEVECLAGKRSLFRQLTCLLDRMESGLWSKNGQPEANITTKERQ